MTDKLASIKPGDRVRVAFEGKFERGGDDDTIYIFADGGSMSSAFLSGEIKAPTFKIERIESPIKVGDKVLMDGIEHTVVGEPRAYASRMEIAVWSESRGYVVAPINEIERRA